MSEAIHLTAAPDETVRAARPLREQPADGAIPPSSSTRWRTARGAAGPAAAARVDADEIVAAAIHGELRRRRTATMLVIDTADATPSSLRDAMSRALRGDRAGYGPGLVDAIAAGTTCRLRVRDILAAAELAAPLLVAAGATCRVVEPDAFARPGAGVTASVVLEQARRELRPEQRGHRCVPHCLAALQSPGPLADLIVHRWATVQRSADEPRSITVVIGPTSADDVVVVGR